MRIRLVVLLVVLGAITLLAFTVVPGLAGEKEAAREAAIAALGRAYVEAFSARDADALAACFWPDAEYVGDDGVITSGRDAIRKQAEEFFEIAPPARLEAELESRRFPAPNLAVSTGIVSVIAADDHVISRSRFTVVAVSDGEQWLMASMRDFQLSEGAFSPEEHMEPLSWLVGDWEVKSEGVTSTGTCRSSEDGAWLVQEFLTKSGDKVIRRSTQRIGWDPMRGRYRSWTWGSDGGFSEALWSWSDRGWVLHSQGVSPSGDLGTGLYTIRYLDADSFRWEARDQVVGEVSLPDEDRIVRRRRKEPR